MRKLSILILGLLCLTQVSAAQLWTGIIDPTRAIDWTTAGVPGGITARTTVCANFSPGATATQINSAIAACGTGQVVQLAAGTYSLTAKLTVSRNNVTLRGAGSNLTKLVFASGAGSGCGNTTTVLCITGSGNWSGGPDHLTTWTAGFTQGATSITLGSTSGLSIGQYLILDQLDDASDPGNIFVCGTTSCSSEGAAAGGGRGDNHAQMQFAKVTNIAGNVVTIAAPGLYMPNWRIGQTPGAWWATTIRTGVGIEDLTIDNRTSAAGSNIVFNNAAESWLQNVASIGGGTRSHVDFQYSPNNTIRSSYFYGASGANLSYGIETWMSGNELIENNIFQHVTSPLLVGAGQGSVFIYNYSTDQYSTSATWNYPSYMEHDPGTSMNLMEGNSMANAMEDDIHGTHNMNTFFRNRLTGRDDSKTQQTVPFLFQIYSRYANIIGNVLGTAAYHNNYEANQGGSATNCNTSIYNIGWSGTSCSTTSLPNDAYTLTSMYRWGNYDVVNAAVQWNNAEVPTGLALYANAVPVDHTLPPSFFYASEPSWWGAGTWPPIGPDVTGGTGPGGFSYAIPAETCYANGTFTGGIMNFDASACYAPAVTPCTSAPSAFTATAGSTTATSTAISWTTSCPATTRVGWSAPSRDCCDYYSDLLDTTGSTSHAYTITSLVPRGTYKFYACSSAFTSGVPDTNPNSGKTTCYTAGTVTTSNQPTTATLDYDMQFVGSHHLLLGGGPSGYITPVKATLFVTQVPSGFTQDNINLTFTLPAGVTVTPFNLSGADTWNATTKVLHAYGISATQQGKWALVFSADSTAVAGTYDISIAATTEGQSPQVTHTFTYSMTIEAAPSFTFATPTSYPTITNKSSWETWMTTYGAFYCAQDYGFQINPANGTVRPNNSAFTLCGIGVENCSWYYDGGRVYWQVRDYDQAHSLTGNPTQWNQCIANVNALYRDGYVLAQATPGKIPGYTVFPLGETQDWLRNSDIASKNSVNAMTLNSAYGTASGTLTNANALVEPDQIRETAYMINACISNQQNGNVCSAANLNFYIGAALGHIMQWTTDGSTAFNQPFMSGLECEALLRAYDYGIHDPRIPAYCKLTWDWLYANAWQKDSSGSGFWYNNNDYLFGIQHSDMRPLNNMVAPMAAWVFKSSGTQSYATQALAVFDGWVSNGTNNFDSAPYGKTFSQGYRWSFDLISWLSPPTSTTVTVSPLTATIPVLGSQQFSSNPSGATWSKSSGCSGAINATTGIYTASSAAENCTLTATVGSGTGTATVTSAAVQVTPATASLTVGGTQQFTANFPGAWTATGGTILSSGAYTAPQSNGTYTITSTATNGGSTGTATVTVTGAVTNLPLTISPTSWNYGTVTISTNSDKQFTLTNPGTGSDTISSKSITAGGLQYSIVSDTCGATLAGGASCTFSVRFNSAVAGTWSGNLNVTDSAGGNLNVPLSANVLSGTNVSVSPTAVTLPTSSLQQFTANVAVTWSASCGTINSGGFYTAPVSADVCTVTATHTSGSNAQAIATVNALAVTPLAVTLQVSSTQQFSANFPSTWAVTSGSCTITNSGLMTAPGSNGSCIVQATAQNGGSTATASVSVVGAPSSTPGTQGQALSLDAGTIR